MKEKITMQDYMTTVGVLDEAINEIMTQEDRDLSDLALTSALSQSKNHLMNLLTPEQKRDARIMELLEEIRNKTRELNELKKEVEDDCTT